MARAFVDPLLVPAVAMRASTSRRLRAAAAFAATERRSATAAAVRNSSLRSAAAIRSTR
ncbi:hypothetical protein [Streptomyces aquilus]|uniref:hypothetical protein n=1 Tax=Streptomyces aquilus TaxID=2548456 RepID=UPI001FCC9DCE|nr:hypothetical protein [Streptomyces aquilus]